MIRLAIDAAHANKVLNDPVVRPDVAEGTEPIDISALLMPRSGCLVLEGSLGAFLLYKLDIGCYETHTFILPEGRGAWGREFARAGADWMFLHTDAVELVTKIPEGHVGAKALAMGAGMRYEFTRYPGSMFRGKMTPMMVYGFRIQDWASHASWFGQIGQAFHEELRAEVKRLLPALQAHDDSDEDHDKYTGIAYSMMKAGQARKGVAFYNRWARLARHSLCYLMSEDPLAIRIDVGTLTLDDGNLRLSLP